MPKHVSQLVSWAISLLIVGFVHAQEVSIPAFPGATKLDSTDSESPTNYDFITGPAEKIKRDVLIENSVRVTGQVIKSTYSLPSGTKREEVFDYYQDRLQDRNAQTVFLCQGPDCGQAATWSGQIFKRRDLSAPIRHQSYSASVVDVEGAQTLFAIYVVARGNLRVMAHIEEIKLAERITLDTNQSLQDELVRRGAVVLRDIEPSLTGSISSSDLARIVDVVKELSLLVTQEIYVVCHIHGSRRTQVLIDASSKCAETVAQQIESQTSYQSSSFGAGPLIPLDDKPLTRIELVVPALLRRE